MQELNVCGMKCPQPLIETKKRLSQLNINEKIIILLDDETAKDNVTSFLSGIGFEPKLKKEKDHYEIIVKKTKEVKVTSPPLQPQNIPVRETSKQSSRPIIVLKSDYMGHGAEDLGKLLIQGFINTLPESEILPEKIICYNSGIHLVTSDSPVLASLKKLENMGVSISSCGTCLDYYEKKKDLEVGCITNMYDIISSLTSNNHCIIP